MTHKMMVRCYYDVVVYYPARNEWRIVLTVQGWEYDQALIQAALTEGQARVDRVLCQGTVELTRRTVFKSDHAIAEV